MLQHAILSVSGISCSNIQCPYIWPAEGWAAVWQVEQIERNGGGSLWQLGVVTAGEQKNCPICQARQKLPKIFNRAEAIAEVASFSNGKEQTAGYFCRLDCSKGKIESVNGG
jgi:hypothetical protein